MLSGSAACTSGLSRKSTNASAPVGVLRRRSSTPAYSTWRKQVSSSALVVEVLAPFGDGERRRGVVGQHDRPVAVAAALGEVDLVGVATSRR